MNERIKEFAEQAMQYATARLQQTHRAGPDFVNDFREKFAELIVKECTNIILHYTDVDEGVAVAKKHFGVK